MLTASCAMTWRRDEGDRLTAPATARSRAYYHAMLGEADEVFQWFEPAINAREYLVPLDVNCHVFAPYRADPRFHELLRRMKLPALSDGGVRTRHV